MSIDMLEHVNRHAFWFTGYLILLFGNISTIVDTSNYRVK